MIQFPICPDGGAEQGVRERVMGGGGLLTAEINLPIDLTLMNLLQLGELVLQNGASQI